MENSQKATSILKLVSMLKWKLRDKDNSKEDLKKVKIF